MKSALSIILGKSRREIKRFTCRFLAESPVISSIAARE